jgi:hypothetical protein
MEFIAIILTALISAGAVVAMAYFFLKNLEKTGQDRGIQLLQAELKKERQKYFLPNRVEAYQRSVLLMERISPNNLIMRLHNPGLPAKALQADVLNAIRQEFDHNVAQQLFVSPEAWDMVKSSKEETIKIINIAGNAMSAASLGTEFSTKVLEICAEVGALPTEITIGYLKEELQRLF